ncbi:hypothetical protein D9756_009981 [Leucocoprinus leucothites]|uniref:F-box domain-containing protein n=1 Tax=Leucocoprinus leucothites TaxID=201217 RepID=A0A8H5CTD6_9AGAR|nr:hypothetical protein D9756_009981 [Leucoagaricus leucothites]
MSFLPLVSKSSLRAIHPPTPSEILATRRSLQKGIDRLQALEDDVSHLQKLYNSLLLQQKALNTFIDCHKELMSPFNRLPPDILQEIFYHCLPISRNATMSIDEPPLSLGRVCKRWRHIAYSTPRLWTTLHIVAVPLSYLVSNQRDKALLDAISSWLSRSGALPLSISVYHDVPSPSGGRLMNNEVQPYLNIIARHAHRWKSVYFVFRDVDWIEVLSQFTDIPLLEVLHVCDHGESSSWNAPDSSEAITTLARDSGILRAPRLRSLDLPCYLIHSAEDVQWQNLTSLGITYRIFVLEEFARISSQCNNLTECIIAFTYVTSSWNSDVWQPIVSPAPSTPYTMPALRTLTIFAKTLNDAAVGDIFERISAPALAHLTWGRFAWPSDEAFVSWIERRMVQSLSDFLGRLVSPLEELELSLESITDSTLVDILKLVPGLKRLSLGGTLSTLPSPEWPHTGSNPPRYPDDPLLGQFTPCIRNHDYDTAEDAEVDNESKGPLLSCLCPNLEVLHFYETQFSHESVIEFIHSRTLSCERNRVARLRKLSIVMIHALQSGSRELDIEGRDMQDELLRLEDTAICDIANYNLDGSMPSNQRHRGFYYQYDVLFACIQVTCRRIWRSISSIVNKDSLTWANEANDRMPWILFLMNASYIWGLYEIIEPIPYEDQKLDWVIPGDLPER